jgi:AraC-like DNA-binding protein
MPIEPHLNLVEVILHPAGEWTPDGSCWTAAWVADGFGYCLHAGVPREFKPGEVIITGPGSGAILRASQLGEVRIEYFRVVPERLSGVITVTEWRQLEAVPAAPRVFQYAASDSVAHKFARLAGLPDRESLAVRAALLELWASCASKTMTPLDETVAGKKNLEAAFRQFIGRISEKDLLSSSLADLAAQLNCSERHLSRLFRLEFGMSLREKQTEYSLQRACQLLLDPHAKIRGVAYDTGYRHVGFFNALFKKRFGLTPKEWRQQNLPAPLAELLGPVGNPPARGHDACVLK